MTEVFIQPSPERVEAINKNLDERGAKEDALHAGKMKNHVPFKAYKKKSEISQADIDAEVNAK